MGNCVAVHKDNRIVSLSPQDVEKFKYLDGTKSRHLSAFEEKRKEKKSVRFNEGGGGGGRGGGAVRIRVLVTKEELRDILTVQGDELRLEQIVKAVKYREYKCKGRRRVRDDDCEEGGEDQGVANGGWRPTLESIPEDH